MCLRSILSLVFICSISWGGLTAQAQHGGDLEFDIHDGHIEIENGEPSFLFASRMFEGGLAVGGPFNRQGDDPGFEAHNDLPDYANDIIGFNLHAGHNGHFLHFFDAIAGSLASSHSHEMDINWGAGNLTFDASTGGSGLIGQIAPDGEAHFHVDFWLNPSLAPGAESDFGAYGFLMSLTSDNTAIEESDPFWVILNYGMSESAFESATTAFTGVPEPSGLLLLVGLGIFHLNRRRR